MVYKTMKDARKFLVEKKAEAEKKAEKEKPKKKAEK